MAATSDWACLSTDGTADTVRGACNNPVALALPANGLETTLPFRGGSIGAGDERVTSTSFLSEVRRHPTDDKTQFSANPTNGEEIGFYKSIFICLDSTGNLAPCYECQNVGGSIVNCNDPTVTKVIPRTSTSGASPLPITRYVMTYGPKPTWWNSQGGKKAIQEELWRRAFLNRTRGSHTCGVLLESGSGHTFVIDDRFKKHRVQLVNGATPNFCIDNGQGCMSILPDGVENFLRNTADLNNCLDGNCEVFFCMSAVKDPYANGMSYHFDSVDSTGFGAPLHTKQYVSAVSRTTWIDNVRFASMRMSGLGTRGFAINDASSIELPFNKKGRGQGDFTLSIVVHRDNAAGSSGTIIGPIGDGGFHFVAAPSGDLEFFSGSTLVSTRSTFVGPSLVSAWKNVYETGVHTWTVIQKNDRIQFYLDGVEFSDTDAGTITGGPHRITLGPIANTYVLDVRYYEKALNETELKKNIKVDSVRYGIIQNIGFVP